VRGDQAARSPEERRPGRGDRPPDFQRRRARFEAAYPEGTRERRAYAVLLYTGLRVGDAARLGRQHLQEDGTIKLRTERPAPTS
jgi:integrase